MHVKQALADGYTAIVVVRDQVFVTTPDAVFAGPNDPSLMAQVFSLSGMLLAYRRNVGRDESRVFSGPQVAKLAGLKRSRLHKWTQEGLARPSRKLGGESGDQVFDYWDAFLAAAAGCMRRAGIHCDIVKKAMACFFEDEKQEAERCNSTLTVLN